MIQRADISTNKTSTESDYSLVKSRYNFIKNSTLYLLSTGGTHALPYSVVENVFGFWTHNKLIDPSHTVWEIGMGVPMFALGLGGFFDQVVATDTSIELYSKIISFFEMLTLNEEQQNDGQDHKDEDHVPRMSVTRIANTTTTTTTTTITITRN